VNETQLNHFRARRIPRRLWGLWALLCILTLLNANSVAVLAGAPERLFNPLLLLVALAVVAMVVREARKISRPPVPAVLVFVVLFLLVGMFAATTGNAVPVDQAVARVPGYLAAILLLFAGVFMAMRAIEYDDVDLLLKTLFWPFVIASLSGVLFVLVPQIGNYLTLQPGARLHGVFGNFNELGGQAGYALVIGLVLSMRSKQRRWVVMGVVAALTGAISSFSKAALLGMLPLFGLLAYAASGARVRWRPLIAFLAASAVTVVGGIWLANLLLTGRLGIDLGVDVTARLNAMLDVIKSGALDETTTTGRTSVWLVGLQNWSASPIVGLGVSGFDRVAGVDMEIHSTLLRVLGETGLIGMTAFLVMVASLVLAVLRSPRRDIHVLGLGFLFVQLPAILTTGGILLERNQNIISGCVVGLLAGAWSAARQTSAPDVLA
jgi:O-antigen ligase